MALRWLHWSLSALTTHAQAKLQRAVIRVYPRGKGIAVNCLANTCLPDVPPSRSAIARPHQAFPICCCVLWLWHCISTFLLLLKLVNGLRKKPQSVLPVAHNWCVAVLDWCPNREPNHIDYANIVALHLAALLRKAVLGKAISSSGPHPLTTAKGSIVSGERAPRKVDL